LTKGYRNTDKPNPRGEVYIGGENITLGYYNMPEKTAEDFSVSKDGIRYFATGDIAEMLPSGNMRLVDRKKDLVKLQSGEYVSLNKVESIVKLLTYVDNCCVVANSYKSNCVLLACPNVKRIKECIKEANKEKGEANEREVADIFAHLEANPSLVDKLTKEMLQFCMERGCDRFEVPTKIKFVKEAWLPDSGLVTDSLKLKRKEIENFYKREIELLYN
jgi:long-chain acyl-CoA synthetase